MAKDYGELLKKLQEMRGPVTVDPEHMKMFGLSEDDISGLLGVEYTSSLTEDLADVIEKAYKTNTGVRPIIDQDIKSGTDEFLRHLIKFIRALSAHTTNEPLKTDLSQKSLQIAKDVYNKLQTALRPVAAPGAPAAAPVEKNLLTEEEALKYFGTSLDNLNVNIQEMSLGEGAGRDISSLVTKLMRSRKKDILALDLEARRDLLLKLFRTIKNKKMTTMRQMPDQRGGVVGRLGLTNAEKKWLGAPGDDTLLERMVDHIVEPRERTELFKDVEKMTPEERAQYKKKQEVSERVKKVDRYKAHTIADAFLDRLRNFLNTLKEVKITSDRVAKIQAALEESLPSDTTIEELQAPLKSAMNRSGLKKGELLLLLRQDPESQAIKPGHGKDDLAEMQRTLSDLDERYKKEKDSDIKAKIKKEYNDNLNKAKRMADLFERSNELQPLVEAANSYVESIDNIKRKFADRWLVAEAFQRDLNQVINGLNEVTLSFKDLTHLDYFRKEWNIPGYLDPERLKEKIKEKEKLAAEDESDKSISSVMKRLSKLLEDMSKVRTSLINTLSTVVAKILKDVLRRDPSHVVGTLPEEEVDPEARKKTYSDVYGLENVKPENIAKIKMEETLDELKKHLTRLRGANLKRFYTRINDKLTDMQRMSSILKEDKEKDAGYILSVVNKLRDVAGKIAAAASSRFRAPSTMGTMYDDFYFRRRETPTGSKELPDFFTQDSMGLVEQFKSLLEANGIPDLLDVPGKPEEPYMPPEELEKKVEESLQQVLHIPGGFEDWLKNRPRRALEIDHELARLAKSKEEREKILREEFKPVKELQDNYIPQMNSLIRYIMDPLEKLGEAVEKEFSEAGARLDPRREELKKKLIGIKDLVNRSKDIKDAAGVTLFEKMKTEESKRLAPKNELAALIEAYSSKGKSFLDILKTKEGKPASNENEEKFLEDLNNAIWIDMGHAPEDYLEKLYKSDPEAFKKYTKENWIPLRPSYKVIPNITELKDTISSFAIPSVKRDMKRVLERAESTYEKDKSPLESILDKAGEPPENEDEKMFVDKLNGMTGRASKTLPTKKELGDLIRDQIDRSKSLSEPEKKFVKELNEATGESFVDLPSIGDLVKIHGGLANEYRAGITPAEEEHERKETAISFMKELPAEIKNRLKAIPTVSRKKYEAVIDTFNEKRRTKIDNIKEYRTEIEDVRKLVNFGKEFPELSTDEPARRVINGVGETIRKLETHIAEYKGELKPLSEAEREKKLKEKQESTGTFKTEVVQPVEAFIDLQNRIEIDDFLYYTMRQYCTDMDKKYKDIVDVEGVPTKDRESIKKYLDDVHEMTFNYIKNIAKMEQQIEYLIGRLDHNIDIFIDSIKEALPKLSVARKDADAIGGEINVEEFLNKHNIFDLLAAEIRTVAETAKVRPLPPGGLGVKELEEYGEPEESGKAVAVKKPVEPKTIDVQIYKYPPVDASEISKVIARKIADLTDQLKVSEDLGKKIESMKESQKSYLETQVEHLKKAAEADDDDKSPSEIAIEKTPSRDLRIEFKKPEFLRVLRKAIEYFKGKEKDIRNWMELKSTGAVKGKEYKPEEHEEKYYKHFFGDLSMHDTLSELTKVIIPGMKMLLKQKALPEGSKELYAIEEAVDKIEDLLNKFTTQRTQVVNRHKEEFKKYVDETVRAELLESYLEPDPKDPSKMVMKELSKKEVDMLKRMYLQQLYRYMDDLWIQRSGQNVSVWGPRDRTYYNQVFKKFRDIGGTKSNKKLMSVLRALKAEVRADDGAVTGVRYKSQQLEEDRKKIEEGFKEQGIDPQKNAYYRDLVETIDNLKNKEKQIKVIFDKMKLISEAEYISRIREGLRTKLEGMPEETKADVPVPGAEIEKKQLEKKERLESRRKEHTEELKKKKMSVLKDLDEVESKESEIKVDVDRFTKKAESIRYRLFNLLSKEITPMTKPPGAPLEEPVPTEKSAYTKDHPDFNLRILYGSEMQEVIAEMLSQSLK